MMKNSVTILLSILLVSCFSTHRFKRDNDGFPIIDMSLFTLDKKMNLDNSRFLDTTALYVELVSKFSSDYIKENPMILMFHNDGFFVERSKKYFFNFIEEEEKYPGYYKGRFSLEENKIKMESFYPSTDGKTNRYKKVISDGEIHGDTISIEIFKSQHKYIKRSYEDVFK
jgi:hypothetical protein